MREGRSLASKQKIVKMAEKNPFQELLEPLPPDQWRELRAVSRERLKQKGERISVSVDSISNTSNQITAFDKSGIIQ